MSFLNKARAQAQKTVGVPTPTTGATVAPIKPPVPGKPGIPGKPPVNKPGIPKPGMPKPGIPKPPVQNKPKEETPLESKSNPFLKKTEPTIPMPTEDIVKDPEMMAPIEEAKAEVKAKAAEEKVKETTVKEEKVESKTEKVDEKEAETKDEAEAKEEVKEIKKKTTTRKKATAKAKEPTDVEDNIDIPSTDMDYSEAMVAIKSNFVDPEWEEFREDIISKLNDIHITSDMNTTALKETISSLSALRESIWVEYNDTKTAFEKLTAKEPEGLIERIKKLNASGSNAEERKINSILAVMNHKDGAGRNINLFELLDETRDRYNFLKSVMDSSQYKTNVLVTMLGSLKLER